MKKIYLVAKRELNENLRTKGFWIGILIFPVILTVMMVVPTLLERARSARHYAVIDRSGWLLPAVIDQINISDLTVAFYQVVTKSEEGDLGDLPEILLELAPDLMQLPPEQLGVVATAIVDSGAMDNSALAAPAQRIVARAPEILAWLASLSPDEAKDLSSSMSEARYALMDAAGRSEEQLNEMILDGQLFAYMVLAEDPVAGTEACRYISNNLTDDDLRRWFRRMATTVVRERRLQQENIAPEVAVWIQRSVVFESDKIGDAGTAEEVSDTDTVRQWAPVAFLYLLWISVFTASQMLLTNTIEEKSNRIIEVLLSSVSPLQLMAGKIAGLAATGLIQVGSWMLMFWAGTKIIPRMMGAPPSLDLASLASDPTYVVSFLVYFLLGYLFYASLLVAIGSVVNTIKEGQNLMGPVTLTLMVPLMAMIPIGKDPNGTLAKVLSYIPPFTPFAMMNRAAGPPTTFEYVTTSILLLLSIGVMMWAAAKVFRIGILLTGKPPKLREIIRWVKAPVGAVPQRGE